MVLTGNDKLTGVHWGASHIARRLAQCWAPHWVLHVRHTFVANWFGLGSPAELKQTLALIAGA
jgi:hypothetical protein